jgi:DNA-binding NarL/FixJ family response regulator
MQLMTEGMTNRQIAGRLSVTVHAVKFHLASIYRKLEVHNRTEAVVAFLGANDALKTPH